MEESKRSSASDMTSFASVQARLAACSKVVGEAFFPVMVEALADALSVRWVMLCSLHPSKPGTATTVAVWDNGPGQNFEYELENSPCADIVGQGACCYPDGIIDLFPRDQMLKDMGAKSYVGTPLYSSTGEVLGLLAALDTKPFENVAQATEIVELFSGRAAAELERLSAASLNERLGRIVEDSISEIYLFNADDYRFKLVNRGARENLGYSMEELREITPWEIKPHFTKDEFVDFVTPLLKGDVPNLLFETVHERKDGTCYDVAVQLQFFPGVENMFYASINDITHRKRAEEAKAHLAAIVACSSEGIISKSLDGTIKSWNRGAEKIFGYSATEMVGKSIRRLIPAERQNEEEDILARISKGEQVNNYETVRLCRDGRQVDVSVTVSPIYDAAGNIVGASKIAHDISDRKRAEARERLLTGEVNHRAKNMLTLVQVIARQTAASDVETFARRFEERIMALSASHDVLVHSFWQNVPLTELVQSQLAFLQDSFGTRIKLSGPALRITAAAAQAIGMALHELATNAAKYGALANDQGTIEIAWKIVHDDKAKPQFLLEWTEAGGPAVTRPERSGFGSTVIDRILAASLEGEVQLDWRSSGLACQVTCAADKLLERTEQAARKTPDSGVDPATPEDHVPRILIVEDEILIGLEISQLLKAEGYDVIGPATTIGAAIAELKKYRCDAAVLDINLGRESSEPLAKLLAAEGTPYISVSGCDPNQRPPAFANTPHIAKPIPSATLVKELRRLLETVA